MSINVTVKGNPVSIKHGKMVTADPNHEKKELEKRRLMRLEQVRQQSKEIAETVRNKVRKEKKRQMSEIERDGKEKMKNWQNRKLLELQNQYKEALEEIGMGHREAEDCIEKDKMMLAQRENIRSIANSRGKAAASKLQVQKNEDSFKKAVPVQRKKLVRDVENTRAVMISNLKKGNNSLPPKKTMKKRKTSANINITIPSESEGSVSSDKSSVEVERFQNGLSNIAEEDQEEEEDCKSSSASSCECDIDLKEDKNIVNGVADLEKIETETATPLISDDKETDRVPPSRLNSEFLISKTYGTTIKEQQELIENFRKNKLQVPVDTRISDRIRQRQVLAEQPDYCDFEPQMLSAPDAEFATRFIHNINSVEDSSDTDKCVCCKMKCCKKKKQRHNTSKEFNLKPKLQSEEKNADVTSKTNSSKANNEQSSYFNIPSKPPIRLKPNEISESARPRQNPHILETQSKPFPENTIDDKVDSNKIPYYDHRNRFHSQKIVPSSSIEKITSDSVEVLPNIVSETEWREKMLQRDQDAQIRGKKALEKEKIHRDYQDMIQKLPLLQRKQRIQEMYKDKPEYHMSDERLRELERKRQNALENAYAKAMPNLKPSIVTLPSRKPNISYSNNERGINIKVDESRTLNVGKWDVDYESPKLFSAEEVQEIIKVFTGQKPQERQARLKELLKKLKMQKKQLIKEIKMLPKDDSIQALLTDLNSFTDSDENKESKHREENDRKRRRDESENLNLSESSSSSQVKDNEKGRERKGHRKKSSKTPPKKRAKKSKQRVLVLQNMSTQTTPQVQRPVNEDKKTEKEHVDPNLKPDNLCSKTHTPCNCAEKKSKDVLPEELCQIFIKINEHADPEVIVKGRTDQSEQIGVQEKEVSKKSPKLTKTRTVAVGTESEAKENQPPQVKSSKKSIRKSEGVSHQDIPPQIRPSQTSSWREQLSKNSISSSSTSYFSPPDFSKISSQNKDSLYNLRTKPQQNNIDNISNVSSNKLSQSSRTIDPRLLTYIRKLLSMSRVSIDDLAVSSSEVQTPSQSVIEIDSNNPMAQLHNIIKFFNLQAEDIAEQLNSSSASSNVPYNSPASSVHSEISFPKSEASKIMIPERDMVASSEEIKQSVISQYEKITNCCDKRIANIAAMIKKLKEEKIKLTEKLHQSGSDKEHSSTTYLDLPPKSDKSTSSSVDEEEIAKEILEIDMDLARKLRIFSSARDEGHSDQVSGVKSVLLQKPKKHVQIIEADFQPDKEDQEFLARLERLLQNTPPSESPRPIETPGTQAAQSVDIPFVSFLSNIPKLPKLESAPESNAGLKYTNNHRHPPPSKGLITAKKFNDNISLVPHELSTIAEADSVLSTKISSVQISPRSNQQGHSPVNPALQTTNRSELAESAKLPEVQIESYTNLQKKQQINRQSPVCVSPQEVGKPSNTSISDKSRSRPISSNGSKKSTSSSVSSEAVDSIEVMLRSIGMEWAIPTLRKTQEALALTSSSSSNSISLNATKSKEDKSSSTSEVSLKEFLQKQVFTKISSSTFKSDASPCNTFEFSELSAIQANGSLSGDKSQRKTSTPVLVTNKSSSKSNDSNKQPPIFTGESDLSSVKFSSLSGTNNNSSSKSS